MEENKITSLNNPVVKEVYSLGQKKYRDELGLILLEGEKLIEGAAEGGLSFRYIFSTEPIGLDFDCEVYRVNEKIMEKISTTSSPPKVIGVAKKPENNPDRFLKFKKIILLDSAKDGGNLGTIIRTSAAFGVEGIILYGDCVDVFSPKVLRSTVGTIFKLPVCQIKDISELKKFKNTFKFISTVVNSKNKISDINFSSPYIMMFGSEAKGLNSELLELSDFDFTLDMKNNVESLNLSMSVGICLWEAMKNC